jgi:hypothetical protein
LTGLSTEIIVFLFTGTVNQPRESLILEVLFAVKRVYQT